MSPSAPSTSRSGARGVGVGVGRRASSRGDSLARASSIERVYACSDLHLEHETNAGWLRNLSKRDARDAVVVAGGERGGDLTAECRLLTGGRWLSIAPMSVPRSHACSVVLDGELWVLGGEDENHAALQSVEVWLRRAVYRPHHNPPA